MRESLTDPTGPHDPVDTDQHAIARMIDANANRMAEALRVVEDYARYGLDDGYLAKALKTLRHEVTACVQSAIDTRNRAASRDTLQDVGTNISTGDEAHRGDLRDVVAANFGRAQQAARSLEECFKLIHAGAGQTMEQIRYRLYTLQKAMFTTDRGQRLLSQVTIYVIVDGGDNLTSFESQIDRLLSAEVDAIQLREKRLPDKALLERCRRLCAKTNRQDVLAIINDRPEMAVLCRADGVHLGQDDLSVAEARRVVGAEVLIGVSTHSLPQAQQAVLDGADYLGVGPMFSSTTKQVDRLAGPAVLEQVARQISLPLFAIGGINPVNIDQIAAAGGTRIAVSAALRTQVSDLPTTVTDLRHALTRGIHATRC